MRELQYLLFYIDKTSILNKNIYLCSVNNNASFVSN